MQQDFQMSEESSPLKHNNKYAKLREEEAYYENSPDRRFSQILEQEEAKMMKQKQIQQSRLNQLDQYQNKIILKNNQRALQLDNEEAY